MSRGAWKAVAAATALAVGAGCAPSRASVSGADARRLVEQGALLVDVRTAEEFAVAHLPGAVNVPVQELEKRVDELGAKDRPIVVYWRSGNRSGRAARALQAKGFTQLHDLGPMSAWER